MSTLNIDYENYEKSWSWKILIANSSSLEGLNSECGDVIKID